MSRNNFISNKQKITLSLEQEVYLKIKTSNINASELANKFFKDYFDFGEDSEQELKQKLDFMNREKILLEYKLEEQQKARKAEEQQKATAEEEKLRTLIRNIPQGNTFEARLAREKYYKEHPEVKQ